MKSDVLVLEVPKCVKPGCLVDPTIFYVSVRDIKGIFLGGHPKISTGKFCLIRCFFPKMSTGNFLMLLKIFHELLY